MACRDGTDYVIIGNGIAGTTAAEVIRRADPGGCVVLISEEPYPLYNRVALPRFLKGQVREEKVLMRTVEAHTKQGIKLLLETRVVGLNLEDRTVITEAGKELAFDRLLIASGGRPNRLNVPGAEAHGVFNFQTLDDAKAILAALKDARRAVTIGGSFIGYELTEAFRARGLEVTWLMRGPYFLSSFGYLDEDGGRIVDLIARRNGVEVIYEDEAAEVLVNCGRVKGVKTKRGRHLEADVIGVGIGLSLNIDFLRGTPIECRRGVLTDEYLRASVAGVYAAGDVAEFYDLITGERHALGTWPNAAQQGKVAAKNMLGAEEAFLEVPDYTSGLFDSNIACSGVLPREHPDLEAIKWADFENLSYKRLFFKGGRLVGAVLIGEMRGRKRLLELIKAKAYIEPSERPKLLDLV
ncbi:MAG: NAD(P)/FAD-dependent oxidoreductase [Chloroflexota bacterium]